MRNFKAKNQNVLKPNENEQIMMKRYEFRTLEMEKKRK